MARAFPALTSVEAEDVVQGENSSSHTLIAVLSGDRCNSQILQLFSTKNCELCGFPNVFTRKHSREIMGIFYGFPIELDDDVTKR